MFKITEERLFKMVLAVVMLLFLIFVSISEAEKKVDKINDLKINGTETEALTYNYRIENVKEGKYSRDKQVVSYTYFHNNQAFMFRRILGNVTDRFERFQKPLVFRLIYSKDKPEIHELVLTYSLDSISSESLRNFALSYFNVPNIQEFHKLQMSQ